MKMSVERTSISENLPFNLDSIKAHARIDAEDDDDALVVIGQTAVAEIEQFAQIALLHQGIAVTILDPDFRTGLTLPIGPVSRGNAPTITVNGEANTDFEFIAGMRPYIRWPMGRTCRNVTRVDIEYVAGFGTVEADIPRDLSQAVMDQAALHFDGRSPMNVRELTTSPHMARIGARYRGVAL